MRRPTRVVIGATVAVLATTGVMAGQVGALAATPPKFEEQSIDWTDCSDTAADDQAAQSLDNQDGECAEVTVPLDYAKPDGPTLKLTISRIKARDEDARRGVLLLNPGGPGVTGLGMPAVVAQAAPALAASYDLIGMDPRFVASSTPLDCQWPVSATVLGAGPDRTSFTRYAAFVRNLATLCADQKAVLPHASSRNTARDMDVIRAALDEPKLSYLGYSYGSYLGSVYMQMFPRRVDRIVLDSVVDPTVFGPRLFQRSGPAMNAALKAWAAWTARRNNAYRLGTTSAQVLANVELIRKTAERRPLKVGSYSLDWRLMPVVLWVANDSPEVYAEQARIVRILRDSARGAKVQPTQTLAEALAYVNGPAGSGVASAQAAILCGDRPAPRNPAAYLKDIERNRKSDRLYAPLTQNIGPCAFWPATAAEPTTRIGNAVPALLLNTTGDTQTPYAGAKVMHRLLTKSRLVTLRNAYRHGVFLNGGSTCADRAVLRYLVDGVLPGADLTCSSDRPTGLPGGLSLVEEFTPRPVTDDHRRPWVFTAR